MKVFYILAKFSYSMLVMATISKQRRSEASILTSFSISKRNESAYSRTCKDRSKPCLFYTLERLKWSEFCLFHKFDRSKRSELCLFHKLDRSKQSEVCLFHKLERTKRSKHCLFHKLDISKRREVCLFHKLERTKRSKVCKFHFFFWSEANSAFSRKRQDRSEKNKLDWSKANRGGILKTFMESRNRFQGIDSASLCPGGPVQQPYSSSVTSPLRLF